MRSLLLRTTSSRRQRPWMQDQGPRWTWVPIPSPPSSSLVLTASVRGRWTVSAQAPWAVGTLWICWTGEVLSSWLG